VCIPGSKALGLMIIPDPRVLNLPLTTNPIDLGLE